MICDRVNNCFICLFINGNVFKGNICTVCKCTHTYTKIIAIIGSSEGTCKMTVFIYLFAVLGNCRADRPPTAMSSGSGS